MTDWNPEDKITFLKEVMNMNIGFKDQRWVFYWASNVNSIKRGNGVGINTSSKEIRRTTLMEGFQFPMRLMKD